MFESIINCFKIRKYSGLKILIQDLTPYIILATYNILCIYSIYNKKEDMLLLSLLTATNSILAFNAREKKMSFFFIVLLTTSYIINFESIGIITLCLLIFGIIALLEQIKNFKK